MNILISTCNIGIPVLMIFIGILYKCNLYKKIDKTLDLIVPIAMFLLAFQRGIENICVRIQITWLRLIENVV